MPTIGNVAKLLRQHLLGIDIINSKLIKMPNVTQSTNSNITTIKKPMSMSHPCLSLNRNRNLIVILESKMVKSIFANY